MLQAALSIACRRDPTDRPTGAPGGATTPAVADEGTALHTLAERIDPGPGPGLLHGMPDWAIAQYGLDTAQPDVEGAAKLLARWRDLPASASMSMQDRLGFLVQLGFAALAVERGKPDAVTDASQMALLAQLYGTFDMPQMFDPKGLFGSMIGMVARSLAAKPDGGSADEVRSRELMTWLEAALGRLPALHRRMAARMMRETPDSPDLPTVMDRVASASASDPELVVALRKHAMALRGRFATAVHHRELAMACYADLDLKCGDAALAEARRQADAKDQDFAKQLAEADRRRVAANRVLALAESKSVDEQLERAALLVELGRDRAAGEAYAAIRKQHPDDARALVGQIDAQLRETLDFSAAFETLDAAPVELEHRDDKYFELAIGVRAMRLMYVVLPQAAGGGVEAALAAVLPGLVPVRRDLAELAARGNDKGVVLQYLLGFVEGLVPAARAMDVAVMIGRARTMLPEVVELRRKIPESRYAFDLVLAAAQFSPDRRAAMIAAAAPPPIEDATLAMRAAMTRVALAITFDERAELDAVAKVIEAWPESYGAAARTRGLARIDMVRWRLQGDVPSRDRAIARYETVLAQSTNAADVADLSNLGVLLADAGRPDDAGLVFGRAFALEQTSDLILFHGAVLSKPTDLGRLESLVETSEIQVALAALEWLIATDGREGARGKWIAKRKARAAEPALRARPLPTAQGVGVAGSLPVSIGYSTVNGLELGIEAALAPRIFLMPPRAARPK